MLYILYGSDSFSRTERLRALKQELDADGSLESNTVEFEAGRASPAEVMAASDTVPFLSGQRLVVLEGALGQAGAPGRGRRTKRAAADDDSAAAQGPWWALVEYAGRIPETTTVVLVDGGSVDESLLDALKPFATVERFSLPGPREVAGWVQDRARSVGLQIDARAGTAIAELIGSDTWMLASEIDKLAVYAGGARVTESDVKALVPDVRDREAYYLADALADGKAAQATKLLHEMLTKGRHPGQLLLTIENRYRRLAVAREMIDGGETGARIGTALGMSGYGLERLLDQASRFTMERVRWALERIAQSDQDVKEGRLDGEDVSLELLVHDLASGGPASGRPQRVSAAAGSS